MSKLAEFPEHLRLMFLHLWCTGIRGSEVCTLTGDGYEEKDGDYWLKVYQVKMKTYKRIPIPEALYKLVQVYKKEISDWTGRISVSESDRRRFPLWNLPVSDAEIL